MSETQPIRPSRRSLGPRRTVEQVASEQGVSPIARIEELQLGVFESDEEVEEFLAEVRSTRNADLA